MEREIPDIDSFITDEFSNNGMRNIYGETKMIFKDSDDIGPERKKKHEKNKE